MQDSLFDDLLAIFEAPVAPPPPPAPATAPVWVGRSNHHLGNLKGRMVVLSRNYSGGLAAEFRDWPVLLCQDGPGCEPGCTESKGGAVYGRQWNTKQNQEVNAWCPREAVERFAEPADLASHPSFQENSCQST